MLLFASLSVITQVICTGLDDEHTHCPFFLMGYLFDLLKSHDSETSRRDQEIKTQKHTKYL